MIEDNETKPLRKERGLIIKLEAMELTIIIKANRQINQTAEQ